MSSRKKRKKPDLLCKECGQTCGLVKGCSLYESTDEPHVHCPGGLTTYGLCAPCQEKCLEIHRPIDRAGKWKWIGDCGNSSCGYCKALAKEKEKLGLGPKKDSS